MERTKTGPMKDLFIRGTADTPEIDFKANETLKINKKTLKGGIFKMTGISIPFDADTFYFKVIDYIELFSLKGDMLIFEFEMDYYNTHSLRYLSKIFSILNDMVKKGKSVLVNWKHRKIDEDMQEIGEDYKELYPDLTFNVIRI